MKPLLFLIMLSFLACSSGSLISPHAGKMIVPGRGTDEIRVGMERASVVDLFGEPEMAEENGQELSYQKDLGLSLYLDNLQRISQIHFCAGFHGRLPSLVQVGSKTLDVFKAYGSPSERKEVPSGLEGSEDRVLYETPQGYRITYSHQGLAFWFSPLKRVTRIVVFQPLPDRSTRIKPVETGQ